MTTAAKKRAEIAVFCVWVGLILVGSFIKVPEFRPIEKFRPDVIFHFAMYVVLVLLGVTAFGWWAVVPCMIIAGGTEIVQHFLPWREMSLFDFVVNLSGTATGLLVWAIAALIRRDRRRMGDSLREMRD